MAKATKYVAKLKVELSWPKNNYLNTKFGCLNFRNVKITKTCDICVNPDTPCEFNDKSTMIKIMEYMALGKPTVQFNVKRGTFSDYETSLYAEKGSIIDFGEKILIIINNKGLKKNRDCTH